MGVFAFAAAFGAALFDLAAALGFVATLALAAAFGFGAAFGFAALFLATLGAAFLAADFAVPADLRAVFRRTAVFFSEMAFFLL
ncbi:hypothetical protein [Dongia sp.]|uniref:hypothetical protein n=1 Tax=Dongia sp. TaxID=1977262 RepID=UPI0035B08723